MENDALTTQPEPSLRDTVLESVEKVTLPESAPAPETADTKPTDGQVAPQVADTAEQKLGRTANRLRDERGRLMSGKKEATPQAATVEPPPAVATTPAVVAPKRPSTWKKDHWGDWDKLASENPKLAEYLNQREGEYAKGVSTYKTEYDRLKPLNDAVEPYRQAIAQHGLNERDVVSNLLKAHHTLSLGTQDDRIGMVEKLIGDYKMPVKLAYQDQQGQWQLLAPRQQQPQPTPQAPPNIDAIVEEKLAQREIITALQRFESEAPEKYQHYETVKPTMIGLLQAGLATDYPSAYEAALRHPRHADIFDGLQQQQAEEKAAAAAQAQQQRVQRARANTVSVPSTSPAGNAPSGGNGIRDVISDAVRQHTSGRL